MMHWWCTDEALMIYWWCTDDALMMHLWCTDDALMMRWLFTDDVLLVPWWCPDDAMMMHQWCTHDALMMHWWCTDDALSKIWCTGYDMMHIGQVSDLHGRFYGGRINGDKTWRQPTTTDRQGEYRAICLWKMDWQSFAICYRTDVLHQIPPPWKVDWSPSDSEPHPHQVEEDTVVI